MSRFFATGSESESESSSSDEEVVLQKAPGTQSKAFQFSDDEEDTKRVVRSARDKRFDELTEIIRKIKNHKKIKDMGKVLQGLENMIKAYQKAKQIVDKEGVPRFYIRCLVEMEDFVNEVWEDREGRKTMSKNNSKGLSTLRQKLRKYNRDFEKEITDYRENPDVGDEEEEDDEGSDSDNEGNTLGTDFFSAGKVDIGMQDAKIKVVKGDDEESEDDETDWGESSEDESSSSSDDEKYAGNLAAKFLKKAGTKEEEETVKKEKKKKDKEKRVHKREDKEDDDGGGEWEEVKGGIPLMTERPKMFAKDAEINHDVVLKKLNEILAARGKKSTDRTEQIELLIELRAVAEAHNLGPAMSIKIMFSVTSAIYDYNPNVATCMKLDMWQKCLSHISELLQILDTYPDITVGEHISDESENYENPDSPYRLRGCILTLVERMDEEFTKMLQNCDAHSTEYVERLKDEKLVCDIIEHLQAYLEKKGNTSELCRIYLRRIEHMYFKVQQLGQEDSTNQMDRLCKYIYAKDNTDRIRTRAILCHIYHHALHDRWFEARDLMLMSHLQDAIHLSDVPLQILYNRTMVQLGLCAFRHGMIKDSHHALLDIQSGGRAKELLAQGLLMQRQHERNPEQEKIEKRRQMPFHMHINLEQLECVYLVSAMLLEIPYMAAHEFDTRRRMISKSFHHLLKISERQPLVGPPESMREHIVAASKAMKIGDWKACKNYIINEKMNTKVWNLFHKPDKVLNMLVGKIQEESLRTYLFTYSSVYDSISLDILSEMFELEKAIVHGIISKMIINEELMASLDEPTQTVVMHRTEPSRLQSLALQLADKVTTVVENNEKILDLKQGSFFNRTPGQQNINYQRQGGYQSGRGYGQQQDWGQQNSNYQRQGGYQSGRGYGQQQDWGQQNSNYQRQGGYQSGRGYGQQDWGQSNYQRQGGYQSGRGYGNKDWGQSNYQRQGGYQSGRGYGNKEWGKRGQSQRAF